MSTPPSPALVSPSSTVSSRGEPAKRAAPAGVRSRLLRRIKAAPGLPLSAHYEYLGIGWSTLYREVDALQDAGRVRALKRGRHCLLYPAGKEVKGGRGLEQVVLLQGPTARSVARIILEGEASDMMGVAAALDLSPRVAYYHLSRLVGAKLIKSTSTKRYRGLQATPALAPHLRQLAKRDAAKGVA